MTSAAEDIAPGLWSRIKEHKRIQAVLAYPGTALASAKPKNSATLFWCTAIDLLNAAGCSD